MPSGLDFPLQHSERVNDKQVNAHVITLTADDTSPRFPAGSRVSVINKGGSSISVSAFTSITETGTLYPSSDIKTVAVPAGECKDLGTSVSPLAWMQLRVAVGTQEVIVISVE